jgi:hypothetical protein
MLKKTVCMCVDMKYTITVCYVVVVMSGTDFLLQYGDIKELMK